MQQLMDWTTGAELDPLTLLLWLGAVVVAGALGMVFGRRGERRRERQSEVRHIVPENAHEVPIGRWIEEGKQLFNLWQERVAQVTELRSRLDAMAQEIDQLRVQVGQIDGLRAECLHLSQAEEALLLERDQLRSVLGRIGELAQRASQIRPGVTGDTAPEVGP
jgi:regulator of replication initiation timing